MTMPKSNRSSGSGLSNRDPSSPDGPMEQDKGWAMEDLAESWDNHAGVRERLRQGGHLMKHFDPKLKIPVDAFVEKKIDNIKINACVLSPIFQLMRINGRTSPSIERLMEQVTRVFGMARVTFANQQDRIYQDSWAIRRMCTYAKAQQFRDGPPKAKWYACRNHGV